MTAAHAWTTGVVAVLLVGILAGVEYAGRSSRFPRTGHALGDASLPVSVQERPAGVYSEWKRKGVRGCVVVHIGRDLHFTPIDKPGSEAIAAVYPVVVPSAALEYESQLARKNFLWLAMRQNMARQVISVMPRDTFAEKLSMVKEAMRNGYLGVLSMTGDTIIAHELGSSRVITDGHVPPVDGPVVLNVDASIFDEHDPATLFAMIGKAGLRIMLMTCCLSEDNAAVGAESRKRLKEFARLASTGRN